MVPQGSGQIDNQAQFFCNDGRDAALRERQFRLKQEAGDRIFEFHLERSGSSAHGYGLFAFAAAQRGPDLTDNPCHTGDGEVDLQRDCETGVCPDSIRGSGVTFG